MALSDLETFKAAHPKLLRSTPYKGWKAKNPGEATKYETYASAVLAGQAPTVPALATLFGQVLVEEAGMAVDAPPGPIPVPDPAPSPIPVPTVELPAGPLTVHDGGFGQNAGEMRYTTGSLKIEKQQYKRYTGWGVYAMQWPEAVSPAGTLQEFYDVAVEDVTMNPPMSGYGTKEAGFWFGQRTKAARLAAYRCAWMGYWLGGNFDGSILSDLTAREMRNVAMYVEHCARNSTVREFDFEANVAGDGGWVMPGVINFEWAYADGYAKYMPAETQVKYPSRACAHNILLEHGRIKSNNPAAPCVMVGPGVFGVKLRNLKLIGHTGIVYCNNSLHPTVPAVEIDWATIDTTELTGPKEVVRTDLAIG